MLRRKRRDETWRNKKDEIKAAMKDGATARTTDQQQSGRTSSAISLRNQRFFFGYGAWSGPFNLVVGYPGDLPKSGVRLEVWSFLSSVSHFLLVPLSARRTRRPPERPRERQTVRDDEQGEGRAHQA